MAKPSVTESSLCFSPPLSCLEISILYLAHLRPCLPCLCWSRFFKSVSGDIVHEVVHKVRPPVLPCLLWLTQ